MNMKVLLVNGSPHEKGCTYTALGETAKTLNEEGIATEVFWIGTKPLSGCVGCKACLGIGCPAISYRDGKAVIDSTQCVGCGGCKGLCPKQAIG